jgi:hypothetical protein
VPDADLPGWLSFVLASGAVAAAVTGIIALGIKLAPVGRWIGSHISDTIADRVEHAIDAEALASRVAAAIDHEELTRRVVAAVDREAMADDIEARLSGTLGQVLSELQPNGGSSLRDAVARIEGALRDHVDISSADRRRLWIAYGVMASALEIDNPAHPPTHEPGRWSEEPPT